MSNKVSETKSGDLQALAAEAARASESARPSGPSGRLVWKIVGGMALAALAAGLITSMQDIRRYIRITRM